MNTKSAPIKILTTGSNGLLGQKLSSLLLASGRAQLVATSKGANRHPIQNGYTYVDMDITDAEKVEEVVSFYQPDILINTAALTNVDICHTKRNLCRLINVNAVSHLARACQKHGVHLIHLSTDFVFDGSAGPYAEDDEPNPISFYGESKRDAEQIVMASACKWSIIRTVLVYGSTPDMSRSNIVLWAKSALESQTEIKVVNDQWRTPTLAEDLAEGCLLTAEKGSEGIFHVSGKEMMSIHQLVDRLPDFGIWTSL